MYLLRKKAEKIFTLGLLLCFLAGCGALTPELPEETSNPAYSPQELFNMISPEQQANDGEHVLLRPRSLSQLSTILANWDTEIIKEWEQIGWAKIAVPPGLTTAAFTAEMQEQTDILYAEPNMVYELTDQKVEEEIDYRDRLWGLENINAHEAWEITTGSEDVVVAIIDTGVDLNHPEWAEHEIAGAFNATDDPWPATIDLNGHGTHVAATAVSHGETGRIHGVTWDSALLPIRVLNYMTGEILVDYLIEAVTYLGDFAAENPQKRVVANMSLGSRGYSAALKDAIDYANEEGVVLVTSAGNNRKQVIMFPAAYNGVISVAATDGNNEKASFSTTGFWNSVAAPGVKIWSAVHGGDYTYMQGTSMASPHVAGAAALLLSVHPQLTPLEVKNQLEQTAQGEVFAPELGYGVIDAEAMLGSLQPLNYGGLRVESDIEYGVITVFDDYGDLTFFGSTGEKGVYNFHALSPGNYTVYLSHNSNVMDKTVKVVVQEMVTVEF